MTSPTLAPRTKIASMIALAAAAAMIPSTGRISSAPSSNPKNLWRRLKGWDAYHHNMITSSPEEIAKWNAKVTRRNKKVH